MWTARTCLFLTLLPGCSSAVPQETPPDPTPPAPAPPPPPRVPVVIDLHTDTLTQLSRRSLALDAPEGLEAGLDQLRKGGFNAVVYAIWPGKEATAGPVASRLLEVAEREIQRLEDVELARSPAELREIVGRGHLAVVLSLEGAHGLLPGGTPEIDRFHTRGLRVLGPVWSFSNAWVGSSSDKGGGLTDEGQSLLDRARSLGMLVDASHASAEATLQICRTSPVPIVASHSNAWELQHHVRNLSDEALRCIGERGGVIGVNLHAPFLGEPATLDRVVAHMEHIARVGGSSAVALGTDLDGYIRLPEGVRGAADLPRLWEALAARGHSPEELEGWKGENFMRVWEAAGR